jgi:ribosomal-protein-alanine N-acetyltransferase
MSKTETDLTLRYMCVADLPEVIEIDDASFKPSWPERSYRFEINESQVSYMVVLEKCENRPVTGFKRFLNNLRRQVDATEAQPVIVGYAGLWKIADEAHISTIASHPEYRGRKYGEILLAGMIGRAIGLDASYIVLEVRVSNEVAQALYHKYDFEIHGVKAEYYHHDREDAYDMRLELSEENIRAFRQRYEKLLRQIPFCDKYSDVPHPRLGY